VIELKRAEVRTEDGHQVIVLPADIHIDEAEVYVMHNLNTGELTVRRERPEKPSAREFLAFLDSLNIPQEDLDAFMAERPLNVPLEPEDIFGNDE
jgi:hypothetical protein